MTGTLWVCSGATAALVIADWIWGGTENAVRNLPIRAAVAAGVITLVWVKKRLKLTAR